MNVTHWLEMGGYAAFVWPAYGLALIVLGGAALVCWRQYHASAATLKRLQPPARRGE